jgi:nicotinate-nucleotide pyrophosphorylase (carboxylating)
MKPTIATPSQHIREAVLRALEEDLSVGDVTTEALFPAPVRARGVIIAHQDTTLAGIAAARDTFAQVDPGLRIIKSLSDGETVTAGRQVLIVEGDGRAVLRAERVALNFLQHLSGIATLTAKFCTAVRGYPTVILDTRKTIPGLRALEKWAVRLGGGRNHRQSLGDGILIKDNHLALCRVQGQGLADACRVARERAPHHLRIIAEAKSLAEVKAALQGQADVILLDNMTPERVREAVSVIKGRALIEVSGGISLANARDMAAAGAHFLSIGSLTHSAPAADLSLDLQPLRSGGRRSMAKA